MTAVKNADKTGRYDVQGIDVPAGMALHVAHHQHVAPERSPARFTPRQRRITKSCGRIISPVKSLLKNYGLLLSYLLALLILLAAMFAIYAGIAYGLATIAFIASTFREWLFLPAGALAIVLWIAISGRNARRHD